MQKVCVGDLPRAAAYKISSQYLNWFWRYGYFVFGLLVGGIWSQLHQNLISLSHQPNNNTLQVFNNLMIHSWDILGKDAQRQTDTGQNIIAPHYHAGNNDPNNAQSSSNADYFLIASKWSLTCSSNVLVLFLWVSSQ